MGTKNFTDAELSCKCGCGKKPTQEFFERLQELRDQFGHAMTISSAFRCQKHNEKVGGAKNSKHLEGIAVDVLIPVELRYKLIKDAMSL